MDKHIYTYRHIHTHAHIPTHLPTTKEQVCSYVWKHRRYENPGGFHWYENGRGFHTHYSANAIWFCGRDIFSSYRRSIVITALCGYPLSYVCMILAPPTPRWLSPSEYVRLVYIFQSDYFERCTYFMRNDISLWEIFHSMSPWFDIRKYEWNNSHPLLRYPDARHPRARDCLM